ncbi:MAG: DNA sulfur modification protein DndD [Acidimicrobiales bacterium]
MRIERVAFQDFRAYRGRVEVVFPESTDPSRTVYLVGGENGAGKTSLMMALGFALYGVEADGISYRSGRREAEDSYRAALEECYNRHANVDGDTVMSVTVQVEAKGIHYEIHREWWFEEGKLTDEDVRLRIDGLPVERADGEATGFDDRTDAVAQFTETVLPARAARFFFFDGEEVSSIAERDLGKSVISGLDDLLGLDSIAKLGKELGNIERHERDRIKQDEGASEYEECRRESSEAEGLALAADQALAVARMEMEAHEERLQATNEELAIIFDGYAIESVEDLKAQRSRLIGEMDELSREFARSLTDSVATIASQDLLLALRPAVSSALETRQQLQLQDAADVRVKAIINEVLSREVKPPLTAKQKSQLFGHLENAAERVRRESISGDSPLAALSDTDLQRLNGRLAGDPTDAFGSVREQARRRLELKRRIRLVESHLRKFEKSSEAAACIERRNQLMTSICERQVDLEGLKVLAKEAEHRAKEAAEAVMAAEDAMASSKLAAAKVVVARKARRALARFVSEIRQRRAFELEGDVSKTLQRLLHRAGALDRVKIDPTSSAVTLLDGKGEEIPVPSAGEKEIFALSLIHGLGKLSHREAPLVIDTPLGRLDKAHRHAIVADFMPSASHQVIVLSTDSEIDKELYQVIRPHLAWQATIRASDDGAYVDSATYFDQGPL